MGFNTHVYQVKERAKRGEVEGNNEAEKKEEAEGEEEEEEEEEGKDDQAKTTTYLARWETAFSNKCRYFLLSFQLPVANS